MPAPSRRMTRKLSSRLPQRDALPEDAAGPPLLRREPGLDRPGPERDRRETGIFYPLVKRGAYVQKGMKIAMSLITLGEPSSRLARRGWRLLYVRAVPSVTKGGTIASIGVVARSPALSLEFLSHLFWDQYAGRP